MGNKESKAQKEAVTKECEKELADSAERDMALYKSAKDAFMEGNRLFRESKFDLAKIEYKEA